MFTIKRVMNGDTFLEECEKPTLSEKRTNGRLFNEAKALFTEVPQGLVEGVAGEASETFERLKTLDDTLGTVLQSSVREIIDISEDDTGLAMLCGDEFAQQPSTVSLTVWGDGKESIAKAMKPGKLRLEDAVAVLVSNSVGEDEASFTTHYDFIYPGDEVYISNRYGNTVAAIR